MARASAIWLLALFIVSAVPIAQAAEPPSTMIVFDGSGSMWGRIGNDKEPKFAVAREALRRALAKVGPETRVGLAAFGHRRKADCSDTELMLAPEPLDAARILAPLDKFNPRGKGPLVAAMKEAAVALTNTTGAASLIVIHDDPDNCSADPCAAAEELNKSNPKLAIHVISIGLAKTDSQRMACVPRITGGKYFDAQDTGAIATAVEDALKLASLEAKPVAALPPVAAVKPAVVAPQPVEDTGPPGLKLSATLGPGGPAVLVPLVWRISKAGDAASVPPVAATRSATLDLTVPPGSYVVQIQQGLVSARETVEVKSKGATRLAVALQAGAVRLSASLQKGTPALEQAVFAIYEPATGATAARTVWTGGADAPPVFLPVGTWRVSGELDRARAERNIVVTAGAMVDVPLALGAGRLHVKAADKDGGPALDRVTFRITEDDADSPDGRREVARSAALEPEFTLTAGTYYLTARHGQTEVRERVLVNAGDDVTRTLIFALGRLGLQSRLAGAAAALDSNIAYRIERLDAPQDIMRTTRAAPKLEVPAGRYRIESQLGSQNARVTREVDVKSGAQATVMLDHTAANIQLKMAGVTGRQAAGDILWDVRDAQDRSVWQTVQAEPKAYLSPGRYKVSAESKDRKGRADIEVRSGEVRIIEVTLE